MILKKLIFTIILICVVFQNAKAMKQDAAPEIMVDIPGDVICKIFLQHYNVTDDMESALNTTTKYLAELSGINPENRLACLDLGLEVWEMLIKNHSDDELCERLFAHVARQYFKFFLNNLPEADKILYAAITKCPQQYFKLRQIIQDSVPRITITEFCSDIYKTIEENKPESMRELCEEIGLITLFHAALTCIMVLHIKYST